MENLIKEANERLKKLNTRISIQARGGYLSLVGVLPAKPASGKSHPYQQRLPLKIPVSKRGILVAEKEAIILRYKLDLKEFKWPETPTAAKTIQQIIEEFEGDYFSSRLRTPQTETTWTGEYLKSFNSLPIELAAKQMGHSRAIHSRVYSSWIDRDINQKAFELSTQKEGRPVPPK